MYITGISQAARIHLCGQTRVADAPLQPDVIRRYLEIAAVAGSAVCRERRHVGHAILPQHLQGTAGQPDITSPACTERVVVYKRVVPYDQLVGGDVQVSGITRTESPRADIGIDSRGVRIGNGERITDEFQAARRNIQLACPTVTKTGGRDFGPVEAHLARDLHVDPGAGVIPDTLRRRGDAGILHNETSRPDKDAAPRIAGSVDYDERAFGVGCLKRDRA
jgi:hypothetical protein